MKPVSKHIILINVHYNIVMCFQNMKKNNDMNERFEINSGSNKKAKVFDLRSFFSRNKQQCPIISQEPKGFDRTKTEEQQTYYKNEIEG